ncbi:MAG: hypothetical protein IJO93_01445 [Clostridia bacterium]|nr:hypothetical protein [Clostridia bacterium]
MRRFIAFTMAILMACMVFSAVFAVEAEDVVILGDVNADEKVNTGDATILLRHCSGNGIIDAEHMQAADANNDGQVNTSDATYILRVAAGLEEVIILGGEPTEFTVTYTHSLPDGVQCILPEADVAEPGVNYTIEEGAIAQDYTFCGWLMQEDGSNVWRNYLVGQSFVMPAHDVILVANFTYSGDTPPESNNPIIPSDAPTAEPTDDPINPTNDPINPTDDPINPTDDPINPTDDPVVTPTAPLPTATPNVTPTPDHTAYIHYLPGSDEENGGGIKDDGYMPDIQVIAGDYGIIYKDKIPHSVTLVEGEEDAYVFTHWTDEDGNVYYPGDIIHVAEIDEITLTANWENGYRVLADASDIERYVFDDLDNKVALCQDIVLAYYNTEYFYPIGFDSDGSTYNNILYDGPFTGKFEGAGFTIYNLTCEYANSEICSAFFYINQGTVSNFTFKLNQLYATGRLMAGIACTNMGVIRNVDVTWYRRTGYHYATDVNADITSFDIENDARVGGVAAINTGTIANCNVDELTLKVCHGYAGGICAYNTETGVVDNCKSRNVKITFVYDAENYEYGGYEIDGLISMDLGTTTNSQAVGFIEVLSDTFWENTDEGNAVLPPVHDYESRRKMKK